jgi:hypothetical protein
MNFLSYLGGVPASAKEAVDVIAKGPAPTELELSLRQMHADHLAAMQAIKSLTEISVNQTTRTVEQVTMLRDLKRTITASEGKHLAAFELSQRPLLRALDELRAKVNGLDADIHQLRIDRHDELDAHTHVLNTKLNLVAERLDILVKALAKHLILHPEDVTVAPPKKNNRGRKMGAKNRTPEAREAFLVDRIQRSYPDSMMRKRYQFLLNELRVKKDLAK